MEKHTDILIIGFGKAGKTLAAKLASQGKKVVIVEENPMRYGGTCINVACLPTKFFVNSAKELTIAKNSGLKLSEKDTEKYYKKVVIAKKELIAKLRNANFKILDDMEDVEVITGKASFLSDHEVSITTKDSVIKVTSDKIVINTGSKAVVPKVPGLEIKGRIYDNVTFMDEEEFLPRLAVLGAGYIGLEFSDMARKFGSEVTLIHNSDRFLTREDSDDREALVKHLDNIGVDLMLNTKLLEVVQNENSITLKLKASNEKEMQIEVDGLLVATGRIANTEGLDIEKSGIELNKDGSIKVDENLKTTVPHIWAAGDVKGGLQFTYVSLDDFRIILPQLLNKPNERTDKNRGEIPYTVFLDPPYSRVGLNEDSAKSKNISYQLYKMPVSEIPKAKISKATEGHWKILLKDTGEIIGATLFGAESQEIINLLTFAINEEWHYTKLSEQIYTHPTIIEGLNMIFSPQWKVR